jgi:hypothetical protein
VLLPAKTAVGRASASTASKRIFFILQSPRSYFARVLVTNDAWLHLLKEPRCPLLNARRVPKLIIT